MPLVSVRQRNGVDLEVLRVVGALMRELIMRTIDKFYLAFDHHPVQ